MCHIVSMHIDIVPNRSSPPAVLLRESFREGGKVRKRTLANLSALPMEQVQLIKAVLRGDKLAPVGDVFEVLASRPHGAVLAVATPWAASAWPPCSGPPVTSAIGPWP